jgi:uncharacterized spore protein YtfJ
MLGLSATSNGRGDLMKPAEVLNTAKDAITVRRVFGEPIEKDGVTMVPGATVAGGGGGGVGHDERGQEGEGGGFGVRARPAGAFVISDGSVRWRPAIDVNRILAIGGAIVIASLLAWQRMRDPGRR